MTMRLRTSKSFTIVPMFFLLAVTLLGQTSVKIYPADLAVPFGVAAGQIVMVGDYLLFIDAEKHEASIAAKRSDLRAVSATAEQVTVESIAPLTDRSGPRSNFVFRLKDPAGAEAVQAWFKSVPAATASSDKAMPLSTYQVKHKHLLGSCSGRLILEKDRLVFESITDVEHSRRWPLNEIKELKRDNPYAIKVIPFSGDNYDFAVLGQGMDTADFNTLVDRVTSARSR